MSAGSISLVILADQTIVREGLVAVLQQMPNVNVIGASAAAQPTADLARQMRPTAALVHLIYPLCAIDATRRILNASASTHVIVVAKEAEDPGIGSLLADELRQAGAHGLLPENRPAIEILDAIECAIQGKPIFSSPPVPAASNGFAGRPMGHGGVSVPLTHRQIQVLKLVAEGLANKEIADRLGISPKTVEKHRQTVKEKLHTNNAADLARHAIGMGLVKPV